MLALLLFSNIFFPLVAQAVPIYPVINGAFFIPPLPVDLGPNFKGEP